MPASVRLRIMLDLSDEKIAKLDALGPLIAKVTGAFLESRWSWPKQHSALTPFSFELSDPKADEIDVVRLERLAEELQLKLFGTSAGGAVTLLLHDGDPTDAETFVQMDHARLRNAVREPLKPTPFGGRLLKITTGAAASRLNWRDLQRAPDSTAPAGAAVIVPIETTFRGVYFTPRQSFIGSAVVASEPGADIRHSLVDGADQLPGDRAEAFDMACLAAGRRQMAEQPFTGVMFLPICFSSLMRRSTRANYELQLQTLPADRKNQLAAAVYEVPRSPTFSALSQMHDVLGPHMSVIDLQIEDAGFEVDYVPPGIVNSVTLRLPEGDERFRIAALHRFMSGQSNFKRRQIWPAITNVRSRAELKACLHEKTPFITGSAVCGSMSLPIGNLPRDPALLPMLTPA